MADDRPGIGKKQQKRRSGKRRITTTAITFGPPVLIRADEAPFQVEGVWIPLLYRAHHFKIRTPSLEVIAGVTPSPEVKRGKAPKLGVSCKLYHGHRFIPVLRRIDRKILKHVTSMADEIASKLGSPDWGRKLESGKLLTLLTARETEFARRFSHVFRMNWRQTPGGAVRIETPLGAGDLIRARVHIKGVFVNDRVIAVSVAAEHIY